jgi:hypothetical protein
MQPIFDVDDILIVTCLGRAEQAGVHVMGISLQNRHQLKPAIYVAQTSGKGWVWTD